MKHTLLNLQITSTTYSAAQNDFQDDFIHYINEEDLEEDTEEDP